MTKIYDLKGSLVNRKTNIKIKESHILASLSGNFSPQKLALKKKSPLSFKDLNFLESDDLFIMIQQNIKESLIDNISKDAYFLKSNNIMDYSLLYVIGEGRFSRIKKQCNGYRKWRYFLSDENFKDEVWSFAIIDYLQKFNKLKFLEYKYKEILNHKNSYYVSCIDPTTYADRFINFMNSITCSIVK